MTLDARIGTPIGVFIEEGSNGCPGSTLKSREKYGATYDKFNSGSINEYALYVQMVRIPITTHLAPQLSFCEPDHRVNLDLHS